MRHRPTDETDRITMAILRSAPPWGRTEAEVAETLGRSQPVANESLRRLARAGRAGCVDEDSLPRRYIPAGRPTPVARTPEQARVYRALSDVPQSGAELGRIAAVSGYRARKALSALSGRGAAREAGGGWVRQCIMA